MIGTLTTRKPHEFRPGDYGEYGGVWYACTPNGLLANLSNHHVTLHGDRLTVQPSIEVRQGAHGTQGYWHGFLDAGVWRSV